MSVTETRAGTVVIVTYNSASHIAECLDALSADRASWDVVVVDNGSIDDTCRIVTECFPCVRLEEGLDNLGFAGGCNLGAKSAVGEYVIFLNPDVVVSKGALDALAMVHVRTVPPRQAPGSSTIPESTSTVSPYGDFPDLRISRSTSAW